MKNLKLIGVVLVGTSLLLTGCFGSDKEEDLNEEVVEKEENVVENNVEEVENNSNSENEQVAEEEPTFADEVRVLDVETVLLDQEELSAFNKDSKVFIEHDELLYVEHDFITSLLDYELTYDEENTFAEVFKGKGDFVYEPSHEDEGGAIMDIGQVYVEELDEYRNISGDNIPLYKFIEFEGNLYVPERLINVRMEGPINYERRDKVIEIGLRSEGKNIYDIGIDRDYKYGSVEVTQEASDVTIKGKNYEKGIKINRINSSRTYVGILTEYDYSEFSGFIYNKSNEETIEVRLMYHDDDILETVDLGPGETHEFTHNVRGEGIIYVQAKGRPGGSSEAVVIGELR